MNKILNILNLLVLLALLLAIVWVTGNDPGHLTITWHGWEITTTAAIATIGLFILLTLAFYLGQLVSWLTRLPRIIAVAVRNLVPSSKSPNDPPKNSTLH